MVRFFENYFAGEISKSGKAVIAECGGGMTSSGRAMVVCGPDGEKLRPIWIGHRSNENHALFFAKEGMIFIKGSHSRDGEYFSVCRITKVEYDQDLGFYYRHMAKVSFGEMYSYGEGDWNAPLPPKFVEAVKACREKMRDYHCRNVYYAEEVNPSPV